MSNDIHLGLAILFFVFVFVSSRNLPFISFHEGYSTLFGHNNLILLQDGKFLHISLNQTTGSGFVSNDLYLHGFFSASIKLPEDDYTAGVVVAFYMSNGDIFEKDHDEVDFEFLGNIRDKEWRIQTNVYSNGSTNTGREERYGLWFDPCDDFHHYSILWTNDHIIFYVDNIPIREINKTEAIGGDFPSKPMPLYATIWDGSNWATNGGKYKVNYKYAPYIAQFSDLVLHGCAVDPIEQPFKCENDPKYDPSIPTDMISEQRSKMNNLRRKHMQYSYCYDRNRYKLPLPECVIDPKESEHLQRFEHVTFWGEHRRRHGRPHRRSSRSRNVA